MLESSFTSFSDVAYEAAGWPGRWLVAMGEQRMDAEVLMASVKPPVWSLHGENDNTVPMRLGQRLFKRAPEPKTWVQWPLGHSNLHTDPTGRYDQVWRDIRATCERRRVDAASGGEEALEQRGQRLGLVVVQHVAGIVDHRALHPGHVLSGAPGIRPG